MEKEITIGDKYCPSMQITDPEEARRYFEECVEHCMSFGKTRAEAEQIEKANIGYFSGYYGHETMIRVQRLFDCDSESCFSGDPKAPH